jgi:hypothetical protein
MQASLSFVESPESNLEHLADASHPVPATRHLNLVYNSKSHHLIARACAVCFKLIQHGRGC